MNYRSLIQELAFAGQRKIGLEVERQTVKGMLYTLRGALATLKFVMLSLLLVIVFVYSFLSFLNVAITSPDWSVPSVYQPLVVFGFLFLISGAWLAYNLSERTWMRRLGLDRKVQAIANRYVEPQEPALQPEQVSTDLERTLEKFEKRIDQRISEFEARYQPSEAPNSFKRRMRRPNGTRFPRDEYPSS